MHFSNFTSFSKAPTQQFTNLLHFQHQPNKQHPPKPVFLTTTQANYTSDNVNNKPNNRRSPTLSTSSSSLDNNNNTYNTPDSTPSTATPQSLRRALGVDYGRRQIGLAISTLGFAPRPLPHLNGSSTLQEMMQVAQNVADTAMNESCDGIVIGLPVTQDGALKRRNSDSQQGRRCRNFAEAVAALSTKHRIVVMLADERGTTMAAVRYMSDAGGSGKKAGSKGRKDSVAAALILEAYFSNPEGAVKVYPPQLGNNK